MLGSRRESGFSGVEDLLRRKKTNQMHSAAITTIARTPMIIPAMAPPLKDDPPSLDSFAGSDVDAGSSFGLVMVTISPATVVTEVPGPAVVGGAFVVEEVCLKYVSQSRVGNCTGMAKRTRKLKSRRS